MKKVYDAADNGKGCYDAARDFQRGFVRIELPYPPSAWDLYEGWGRTRHLSDEYKSWRIAAGLFINRQFKPRDAILEPFSLSVALRRPNKRQDIDNRSKAVLDCLQHYGVIKNDNQCERLSMQWDANLPAECVVIVQPFAGEMAA